MSPRRSGAAPGGVRPDRIAAAVLLLLALTTLHMSAQGHDAWGPGGALLSVVLCVALLFVASRPLPALALMVGVFLAAQARYGLVPVFALILLFAVYTAAAAEVAARRACAAASVVVAVALDAGAGLTRHDSWTDSAYLVMATAALAAAAAGDAARSRRAYVREVEQRAEQAERNREQAVERRVAEDRLDIARDVHDLVAHHLAVVAVQAEVAGHLVATRPGEARNALTLVRGAAGSALSELGSLLTVLRRTGAAGPPVAPSPTLAQLPELAASFQLAGLEVARTEHGDAQDLPPAVELAAYRLVQEALTNAHKHGTGGAVLEITHRPDGVVIDVDNAAGAAPAAVTYGHGLSGMRERIAAVGGTLRLEHSATGRFHVRAELPAAAP